MSPLLLTLTTTLLTLLTLPTYALSQQSPTTYPGPTPVIAHYSFDTSFTSQFNNYTAVPPNYANAPQPPALASTSQAGTACPFGSCIQFNGQSYLDATPWLPLLGTVDGAALTSWSVGFWVASQQPTGWQGVLGMWSSGDYMWSLRLFYNVPYLIWQYRDANQQMQTVGLQSVHAVSSTGWSHVVVTYNATSHNVQFWADGRLTDTYSTAAVYAYIGTQPALGWKIGMIDEAMLGMNGAMDELWLFSDVLSPDEILLLRAINSIGSCSPGTVGVAQYHVGTCTTCQPGTFAPDIGGLVCEVCPAGTASISAGATSCQACPAGSYAPSPNSSQCLTCPAGYYSPTPGSTACLPCAAGTYSTTSGATTCAYCPANTLSPPASTSQSSCTACPAGSSGGASVPVCCPNGVSAAGGLLASVGAGLGSVGVLNNCILSTAVSQAPPQLFVEQLSDVCGVGYDSVLTSSLQGVYSEFNAFQAQADQTALQRIYCNP